MKCSCITHSVYSIAKLITNTTQTSFYSNPISSRPSENASIFSCTASIFSFTHRFSSVFHLHSVTVFFLSLPFHDLFLFYSLRFFCLLHIWLWPFLAKHVLFTVGFQQKYINMLVEMLPKSFLQREYRTITGLGLCFDLICLPV